jgi:hypothetical protein
MRLASTHYPTESILARFAVQVCPGAGVTAVVHWTLIGYPVTIPTVFA